MVELQGQRMLWIQFLYPFLTQKSVLGLCLQTLGLFSDFRLKFRQEGIRVALNRLCLVCTWRGLTRGSSVAVVDQADGLMGQNTLLTAHMGWVLEVMLGDLLATS